jgi:hypothetical protein
MITLIRFLYSVSVDRVAGAEFLFALGLGGDREKTVLIRPPANWS